jgi:hypothetical protein
MRLLETTKTPTNPGRIDPDVERLGEQDSSSPGPGE